MDILPIVFSVVLLILAIVLSVVGVQMVLVLMELKRTLRRVNQSIDMVETKFASIVTPLQNLGGMASGMSTGFKVFEAFVGWLQKNKESRK